MGEFKLPEARFVPEVDEKPITYIKLKDIIEWLAEYNLCSCIGKNDQVGDAIPARYLGHNRYWITESQGQDDAIGAYSLFSIYDLDPRSPDGRVLLIRYRLTDSRGDLVQTRAQAIKHIRAARLEAERAERMKKKDPKLTSTISIHMPAIYKPVKAQKKALEALNDADES